MDATVVVEIDELELPSVPQCPTCRIALTLSQPDQGVPQLLTGSCEHCHAGYVVTSPADGGPPRVDRRLWSVTVDKTAPGEPIAIAV